MVDELFRRVLIEEYCSSALVLIPRWYQNLLVRTGYDDINGLTPLDEHLGVDNCVTIVRLLRSPSLRRHILNRWRLRPVTSFMLSLSTTLSVHSTKCLNL